MTEPRVDKTDASGREVVVDQETTFADRKPATPKAQPAGGRPDLGPELRASHNWRSTSLGPDADLDGADLSGEDLRDVDFSGASLAGASFANANLANAQFAWARLRHADFTGATGLVGSQFARADLTGARMPATVRFGAFETANDIAESTGKLFLTLLLVCAYSWLTINSTLDAKLLTDTGASQLPILNVQIPIVNFYALVPLALVGFSLVTMLQAQRLWSAVAAAPAALPDGTTMAERAAAWILGPWAAERVMPPSARGVLTRMQARLGALIGWWLVPATVVWFWVRYLHRHDWPITAVQLVALTVGCTAAMAFMQLARATLPEKPVRRRDGSTLSPGADEDGALVWSQLRAYAPTIGVAAAVPLVFGIASYVSIHGVHPAIDAAVIGKQTGQEQTALALRHNVPALETDLPDLLGQVGMRPVAQLAEAEVSTRLATAGAADTAAEPKAAGARLIGADLRFASGEHVYLPLSDLRHADMIGANLWAADLRRANLTGASLVGALLFDADLRKVRATGAYVAIRKTAVGHTTQIDTLFCSRTSFAAANLRFARLNSADLRAASFDGALLQGATFTRARLTHATFAGADLDGADFRGAFGVTADQILAARHIEALYDSTLLVTLRTRSPDRFIGYDAQAVTTETERQRLSGDIEPDSLGPAERDQRVSLVHEGYVHGAPSVPSDARISEWLNPQQATAGPIPYGCTVPGAAPKR